MTCAEMALTIVRHFLNDLGEDERTQADEHMTTCSRCAGKRAALALARDIHEARRHAGVGDNPDRLSIPSEELQRLQQIEEVVKYAVTQRADDICWMDLYKGLAELVGVPFDPRALPRERMLGNCAHFVDSILGGRPYVADEAAMRDYRVIMADTQAPDNQARIVRFFLKHVPGLLGIASDATAPHGKCRGCDPPLAADEAKHTSTGASRANNGPQWMLRDV